MQLDRSLLSQPALFEEEVGAARQTHTRRIRTEGALIKYLIELVCTLQETYSKDSRWVPLAPQATLQQCLLLCNQCVHSRRPHF